MSGVESLKNASFVWSVALLSAFAQSLESELVGV